MWVGAHTPCAWPNSKAAAGARPRWRVLRSRTSWLRKYCQTVVQERLKNQRKSPKQRFIIAAPQLATQHKKLKSDIGKASSQPVGGTEKRLAPNGFQAIQLQTSWQQRKVWKRDKDSNSNSNSITILSLSWPLRATLSTVPNCSQHASDL